jgi:hypothetical protein
MRGRYEKCINISVGKPDGKRSLGRRRCRWKYIKMDIEEIEHDVHWIHLAQDKDQGRAVVNTVMNLRLP